MIHKSEAVLKPGGENFHKRVIRFEHCGPLLSWSGTELSDGGIKKKRNGFWVFWSLGKLWDTPGDMTVLTFNLMNKTWTWSGFMFTPYIFPSVFRASRCWEHSREFRHTLRDTILEVVDALEKCSFVGCTIYASCWMHQCTICIHAKSKTTFVAYLQFIALLANQRVKDSSKRASEEDMA